MAEDDAVRIEKMGCAKTRLGKLQAARASLHDAVKLPRPPTPGTIGEIGLSPTTLLGKTNNRKQKRKTKRTHHHQPCTANKPTSS